MYEDDYLLISGLQHFEFCRRQWALIHIEQQWEDNFLTAEGNVFHERVHDSFIKDTRNGILTVRGLNVKSAKLGFTGTCDAVEFIPAENGIKLNGHDGFWDVRPVEYKHGSTKISDCDRVQATAQAMCLEEMFACEIDEVHIFYNTSRKREKFLITEDLRKKVTKTAEEMHGYFSRGYTPKATPGKACRSCSLAEICLPKLSAAKNKSVKNYISDHLNEDES